MENENFEEYGKYYTTADVVEILDIGSSTLRGWALELEKEGYIFAKNKHNNKRLFVEQDIEMLKLFRQMVKDNNVTRENASKLIVERYAHELIEDRTSGQEDNFLVQKFNEQQDIKRSIAEFIDYLEADKLFKKEMKEHMELEKERLDRHDKLLMQSIRETQELKQATLEQTKLLQELAVSQEKNQGFWSKLFKSNK